MQFFSGQPYNSSQPKAYLNWILFDEQMQYVSTGSSAQQVSSAAASGKELLSTLQNISRSGYLYVYVSNESPQDVYFDDLSVKHFTGPLTQEQSYYPFGLEMQGLSSKAFNKLTSQYKFNGGVELEEELNLYSTFYRQYDQQIGRFTGVDILSEKSGSAYGFGNNNPAMFMDPTGALSDADFAQVIAALWGNSNGGTWSAETGAMRLFQNSDEALGFGIGLMGQYGLWGSQEGFAGSANEALVRYQGNMHISAGLVQGFYEQHWQGMGRETITASISSRWGQGTITGGFWVGWGVAGSDITVSGLFISAD